MIRKITFCTVFACVSLLQGISGASFSNVFVKSGADVVPFEYVNYGPPAVPIAGSQIAQISTAPVDSILSLNSVPAIVSPCVAPCVIPGAPISAVAPLSSTNAKLVTYKSPIANVPVVLAKKDDTASYQYSYAVYDESTGDKKAQSEQSNGSIVQGQYSFIQPDGYRREVVYTADDLKGFNAVVKNFLPESVDTKSVNKEAKTENINLPPCRDVKSEQLSAPTTEAPKETTTMLEIESIETPTEKPKEVTTTPTPAPTNDIPDPRNKAIYSYNDILRCLQSKAQANNIPTGVSPLTYLLIPYLGGFTSLC